MYVQYMYVCICECMYVCLYGCTVEIAELQIALPISHTQLATDGLAGKVEVLHA